MATVDYDKLSTKDKAKLAKEFSDKFNEAFEGEGTKETLAAQLVKQLRQIGSSALVDEVSNSFYNEHGTKHTSKTRRIFGGAAYKPYRLNLRQAIINEFSGGKETEMLNAIGYADDKLGGDKFRTNEDKALLRSEDRDIQRSHFDLIGKDTKVPYLDESVNLGSGTPTPIKKFIKDTVESKKQPESTPAPERAPAPESAPAPKGFMDVDPREAPMGVDAQGDPIVPTSQGAVGPDGKTSGPIEVPLETMEGKTPQRGSRAFRKQSKKDRENQIAADDEKAKEMSSAIPNRVRSQLKLPRTRGTKETPTATPSGGGSSGGSGSDKAGLGYLRSREDMMARDTSTKAKVCYA